ncbi:MAG TPA: 6-phosphofructokinase [Saprospiraceae bacterium]|nr:6-phosphofructokinase [Saprospiraceae bacterium]HRO07309.1 6-phosphofructokinase [Saprospiraceae bacterium]HRP40592.1 6-phosphofructokinase [Saprospiraceae bacterium]
MSNIKRIAVLTSGGDAPGMNAAIRAVVRTSVYHDLHVYGVMRGYDGLINGDIRRLEARDVANIIQRGGTILKTARSNRFETTEGRKTAYDNLVANDIDGLVVIGGNGTYAGGLQFMQEYDIPVVGLPGTIDNDLYGTDYSIGFDTAINTAIEAVDKIRDTADSHNRIFFIEVMGRHSGFIALHTGIGSGAGAIFLPEREMNVEDLSESLRKSAKRQKLFNLVIVAEGNKSGETNEIARQIKIMNPEFDVKVTIIGHLQRGGFPTAMDRVLASRMGHSAVQALMRGESGTAIGLINDKITFTPFHDAIHKRKALNEELIRMAEILAM